MPVVYYKVCECVGITCLCNSHQLYCHTASIKTRIARKNYICSRMDRIFTKMYAQSLMKKVVYKLYCNNAGKLKKPLPARNLLDRFLDDYYDKYNVFVGFRPPYKWSIDDKTYARWEIKHMQSLLSEVLTLWHDAYDAEADNIATT